ncbi:hypothetical protein [Candidatus Electronema sp. TJ]|uniref:hypothetical protein n=1 Tax=Candidatus Electronema sp. TJ TaxID=3401573 RepID=UPI003AA89A88
MQWINTTLELLSPGWVGAIISLVGLIAAVVTYLFTRQRTRLAYCCAGKRLLGLATDGLPEGITVHYRGQDIPRLTRTLVVLWNAGEKTILGEDIVATDPLRLKLRGDGRVLAATVLKTKRDVCQIKALPDAPGSSCHNETHIRFAFLDAEDGAVIEILHTSEESYVEFLGTVRGLPQGLKHIGNIDAVRTFPMPSPWIILAIGAVTTVAGSIFPQRTTELLTNRSMVGAWVGVIYTLAGLALIYKNRRRYPKYLHIEELR